MVEVAAKVLGRGEEEGVNITAIGFGHYAVGPSFVLVLSSQLLP
jgi:hypothetical protein